MPLIEEAHSHHSEDIQDIITSPPSWILRWGISIFFLTILFIVGLSTIISYPDIVKTKLTINSYNSPKPVVSRISSKLVKILVPDGQSVRKNETLAYLESTASHEDVIKLLKNLKDIQIEMENDNPPDLKWINRPVILKLGELQESYQNFYQSYLAYKASITKGFYLTQRAFLKSDLHILIKKQQQLVAQQKLQEKALELSELEFELHKKLTEQKVEAKVEMQRAEAAFIQSKYPLMQTNSAMIDLSIIYAAKEKEILQLDKQINDEKAKFLQSVNSLISLAERWKNDYVLSASQDGKLSFTGIIQQNQIVDVRQEIFYIIPSDGVFFGEMSIPQYNMGKIKIGQEVLIKLKSYPFEEYGIISGNISYVADIPYKDSVFSSRVNFKTKAISRMNKAVKLKNGMIADAEIITDNASLITRIRQSVIKVLKP